MNDRSCTQVTHHQIQCTDASWQTPSYYPAENTDHVISQKPGEICDWLNQSHELGFADGIFHDVNFVTPTGRWSPEQGLLRVVQARHEQINGMFKQFGVLLQRFRNDREFHPKVVAAVANLVQLKLAHYQPPTDIRRAIRRYGTNQTQV